VLLSINRFERKKNVELAVSTFAYLQQMLSPEEFAETQLILAGGYDPSLTENVEYFDELKNKIRRLGLNEPQVLFLPSVSDEIKAVLLKNCTVMLYTPSNEHFGIVPIEAMAAGKPVVATNTGGPLESIADGETGYLRVPNANMWGEAVASLLSNADRAKSIGAAGRRRVEQLFTLDIQKKILGDIVNEVTNSAGAGSSATKKTK